MTDTADPWKIYDVTITPTELNDLRVLEFGHGYWINIAQDLILRLKGSGASLTVPEVPNSFGLPPATYYGLVLGDGRTFTPTVGMSVSAWVGNAPCGQSVVQSINGQLLYLVKA